MNSIPLIKGNTPQEINTSIIALKKALSELEAQDRLLQGTDKDIQNKIKQINELIKGINTHLGTVDAHLSTIDGQITALQPVDTVTSGNMHSVTSNAVFNAIGQWEELYTDGSTISISGMITNNGAYLKIWMQNYLLPSSGYPILQLPAKYNNAMTHWVSRLYYFQNNNSAENPYDWRFANIDKNSGVINLYGTANLYCYGDFILSL